jgi:hypothetical protein
MSWGPGAAGGFQNALSTGLQLGQMVRQQEQQNALMQQRQEAIQLQQQRFDAQQAEAQRTAGIDGLEKFRPLLQQAVQGPEQWAQARAAGANAGFDMSRVPEQFDPNWAKGQLMLLDAARDPEKLDRIGKAMQAFGYTDQNMPGYNEALQEFTRMTFARESTDAQGRPILVFPEVAPAGQTTPSQQAPASAAAPQAVPLDTWQADVQTLGLQGAMRFATSKGLAVPITSDEEYAMLPSGAAYVAPDGTSRRKQ